MRKTILMGVAFGIITQFLASGFCMAGLFSPKKEIVIVVATFLTATSLAIMFRNFIFSKMKICAWLETCVAVFLMMAGFSVIGFVAGLFTGDIIAALRLGNVAGGITLIRCLPLINENLFFRGQNQRLV